MQSKGIFTVIEHSGYICLKHGRGSCLVISIDGDVVKEVREPSYIETHEKVVPLTRTFQSTLL